MEDHAPLIKIRDLSFSYLPGAKQVLSGIYLDLYPGELHLLIGENGAGKSTLASCIAGMQNLRNGTISGSRSVQLLNQHLISIPDTTFQEYLWLIYSQKSVGVPSWSTPGSRRRILSSILETSLGEFFNPESLDEQVALTSSNLQHLYAATLLLNRNDTEVVILDEPTAVLSEREADILYENISEKVGNGLHVTVITHRLEEALPFSSSYTVIRNGRLAAHSRGYSSHTHSPDEQDAIHRAMFAGSTADTGAESPAPIRRSAPKVSNCQDAVEEGESVFRLHNIYADFPDLCPLQDISFSIEAGEILSITGIRDEGLEQLERLLSGRHGRVRGSVGHRGKALSLKNMDELRKRGIRFVPSQRNRFGLARSLRGFENIGIHMIREQRVPWKQLKGEILNVFASSDLDLLRPSQEYSGGMVQRMILHRELFSPLSSPPTLLILADPSWGLDAQHRKKLYEDIRSCVGTNAAALVISSELGEAIELGDRVAILHEGRLRFPSPKDYGNLQLMERYFLGQTPDEHTQGQLTSYAERRPATHGRTSRIHSGGCIEDE